MARIGKSRREDGRNLVHRRRIGMLRGETVFNLNDAAASFGREPARDVVMALDAAHDPAASMDENKRRGEFIRIVKPRGQRPLRRWNGRVGCRNAFRLASFGRQGRIFVDPMPDVMEVKGAVVVGILLPSADRAHFVRQIGRDDAIRSTESVPINQKRHHSFANTLTFLARDVDHVRQINYQTQARPAMAAPSARLSSKGRSWDGRSLWRNVMTSRAARHLAFGFGAYWRCPGPSHRPRWPERSRYPLLSFPGP